jgi:hypothetical protein
MKRKTSPSPKDPPLIPASVLWRAIRVLLNFPYPQICRHSVAADLLSILEEHGVPVSAELASAVVRAEDDEALALLPEQATRGAGG